MTIRVRQRRKVMQRLVGSIGAVLVRLHFRSMQRPRQLQDELLGAR